MWELVSCTLQWNAKTDIILTHKSEKITSICVCLCLFVTFVLICFFFHFIFFFLFIVFILLFIYIKTFFSLCLSNFLSFLCLSVLSLRFWLHLLSLLFVNVYLFVKFKKEEEGTWVSTILFCFSSFLRVKTKAISTQSTNQMSGEHLFPASFQILFRFDKF